LHDILHVSFARKHVTVVPMIKKTNGMYHQ
jgi:hypothetical protein